MAIDMHWWNAGWIIKDEKHAVCAILAMHPDARCCTSSLGMVLINTAVMGGDVCGVDMGVMLDS